MAEKAEHRVLLWPSSGEPSTDDLVEQLDTCSAEGWELVSHSRWLGSEQLAIVLRRRKRPTGKSQVW